MEHENSISFRLFGSDYRFPVPGDCGRLITCVEGHPRVITCGDGKLFDSETLSCLDPDELPNWLVFLVQNLVLLIVNK